MCTLLRTTEFFGGSGGRLIFRSLVSGTRLGYNNLLLLFLLPLELESQRCQNTTTTTHSVLVMRCLFSNDYFSPIKKENYSQKTSVKKVSYRLNIIIIDYRMHKTTVGEILLFIY